MSIPLRKQTKETNGGQSVKLNWKKLGHFFKVWYYFILDLSNISNPIFSTWTGLSLFLSLKYCDF